MPHRTCSGSNIEDLPGHTELFAYVKLLGRWYCTVRWTIVLPANAPLAQKQRSSQMRRQKSSQRQSKAKDKGKGRELQGKWVQRKGRRQRSSQRQRWAQFDLRRQQRRNAQGTWTKKGNAAGHESWVLNVSIFGFHCTWPNRVSTSTRMPGMF